MSRLEDIPPRLASVLRHKAAPHEGQPLPPSVRLAMETALDTDLSEIRVHTTPELACIGAVAAAFGPDVHFAPGQYAPDTFAGLLLLGHELAHVVQQRQARASGSPGHLLLHEPALEEAADRLGLRAALHVLAAREQPLPPRAQVPPRRPVPLDSRVLQAKLQVDSTEWASGKAAEPTWSLDADMLALYEFARDTSARRFLFRDEAHMLRFVRRYGALYKHNPSKFTNSKYDAFFEPVATADPKGSIVKKKGKWELRIEVTTTSGATFDIPVFMSVKRHLVSSFMENQFTPRERRTQNSLVRDDTLLETKLLEFAQLHAEGIKDNLMAFMYLPNTRPHMDADLAIETDTTEIPNTVYSDMENGIHCYPSHGNEVLILNQEEYNAAADFLLWFFRTDERMIERTAHDRLSRISVHDTQARDAKESTIKQLQKTIDEKAAQLKALYAFPGNLSAKTSQQLFDDSVESIKKNATTPSFQALVAAANTALYELMIEKGEIKAVQTPMIQLKDKIAGIKAVSTSSQEVGFKTHKAQVKDAAKGLPSSRIEDIIDWVSSKHTATPAKDIWQTISASKKNKPPVRTQVQNAQKDAKTAISRLDGIQKIEKFYDWYATAVLKGHVTDKLS